MQLAGHEYLPILLLIGVMNAAFVLFSVGHATRPHLTPIPVAGPFYHIGVDFQLLHIISQHGAPVELLSDTGKSFLLNLM